MSSRSKSLSYFLGQKWFRNKKIPLFELPENIYLETVRYPLSQLPLNLLEELKLSSSIHFPTFHYLEDNTIPKDTNGLDGDPSGKQDSVCSNSTTGLKTQTSGNIEVYPK